ncbi:hypothetical protein [Haloplanus halobius]|uniref:hypothetical protein n=1 Tax=Haloplanus halobius TaxID=2934938 RepID=UPI00200E2BE1|nr:hypothetical protein [Haloplanus sp. XH21]
MTDSPDSNDRATAEDETPHGAPEPEEFDGREGEVEESELPPEARDKEEDRYHDESGDARETANPDQHRDEEEYD